MPGTAGPGRWAVCSGCGCPHPSPPERLPAPGVGGGVEVVPHGQSFGPAEARRPAKGQHVGWPERGGADSQGSVKAVVAAGAGC